VQVPSAELKWEEFYPGGPVESFVIGSKEAKHGPTAFFIKFKGGFDSGWHVHESEYAAVVLAGTMPSHTVRCSASYASSGPPNTATKLIGTHDSTANGQPVNEAKEVALRFTPTTADVPPSEAHRHDAAFDPAEAVVPPFARAVGQIFRDHALRISECELGLRERDPVLLPILVVPLRVPFKAGPSHCKTLARLGRSNHTFVWLLPVR
jgi:hypothetical protein